MNCKCNYNEPEWFFGGAFFLLTIYGASHIWSSQWDDRFGAVAISCVGLIFIAGPISHWLWLRKIPYTCEKCLPKNK